MEVMTEALRRGTDQDRRGRTAVASAVVDAGHHEFRADVGFMPKVTGSAGDTGRCAQAGRNADDLLEKDASEGVPQVDRLEADGKALRSGQISCARFFQRQDARGSETSRSLVNISN